MDNVNPLRDGKLQNLVTHIVEQTQKLIVSKLEEKKIWLHPKFEEITTKYWQLLRSAPDADLMTNAITRDQYITVSNI